MRSPYLPLIAVLFAIPTFASAQTPAAMTDGRTSLAFAIPESNGAQVSVWRFTSDRTNLGLALGFSLSGSNEDGDPRGFSINASPILKRYFSPGAKVAPFYRLNAGIGYLRAWRDESPAGPEIQNSTYSVGVGAGVGVDWFATDEISIGGHTGVSAGTSGTSNDDNDRMPWHIGTFNSALTMHIYF